MKRLAREINIISQQGRGGDYKRIQSTSSGNIWVYYMEVTYSKKGYKIWDNTTSRDVQKAAGQIDRDIRKNIDLRKLSCPLYHLYYSFLCQ